MSASSNPAAAQGWVKSVDPKSGRVFYANHITRKTQWEAPEGWVEASSPPLSVPDDGSDDEEPLPANWEVMHDPTTGKAFYVDHERKITQWTRPKAEKKAEAPVSYAPASTASPSPAMARILRSSAATTYQQPQRTYSQEASYFQHPHSGSTDTDFSDTMPALDFSVKKVADKHRLECPHCGVLFTLSKRRHHCRLCGDVFCDACSNHRVTLPLQGAEFEKPVRICDFCNKDVEQGNFFSMRRYLTPLQLFDPDNHDDDDDGGVATPSNVNAALSALTLDLDQMVHNSEGFEEKVTIPAKVLVPAIAKHLNTRCNTADRAIRALASLLSMGSMVGKTDLAHALYLYGRSKTMEQILTILERSGSDRKTLFVQEQAAQTMFYLTDAQIMSSLMQKHSEVSRSDDSDGDYGTVESLDIHRTLRNMLDHSSMNKNPNLQRWSAATVRNLVIEDQRRACLAINEVAARVASGEAPSSLGYESFLDQLASTGGIMILCSLIGAEDSDTRAHATAALGATLTSTRAVDESMAALSEISGGSIGRTNKKDGDIMRSIIAGGGCGSSVSQLLLSADNSVAGMGCDFIASLVLPLLTDPQGGMLLPPCYDCGQDGEVLGACREAALQIVSGSCLPALLSLVRENGRTSRPIELRKTAMETLAATMIAVGEMGKSWADGKYEEGMEANGAPAPLTRALAMLNEEQVIDVALDILASSSLQSLGSARDNPATRIREGAGIILGALSSCSAEAIMDLHSRKILSSLIMSSSDPSMTAASTLRGDAAPRCLGALEAAASILTFAWQHPSGASSELLDRLIECLDAGAITHLFKVLTAKVDWESRDKSVGGIKARGSTCKILSCLFGIAVADDTEIGMRRLMDACDTDQGLRRTSKGPRNIMEAVLTNLQTALNYAHKLLLGRENRGANFQSAILELVEASLLATGSMCGSSVAPGGGEGTMIKGDDFLSSRTDEYEARRKEICKVACDIVVRGGRSGPALLPTLLVGGFGEGSIVASLRMAIAMAQNGSQAEHSKLASSGILVPVSDLLRSALGKGDLYKFSAALALVRFCGPHVAAGSGAGVQSVRDAIRVATNVLTLPVSPEASVQQIETQEALKSECISALESLSKNSSLWSAISKDALPSVVNYLRLSSEPGAYGLSRSQTRCSALRAVLQIVQVPSHAVSAAESGLSQPLGTLLRSYNSAMVRQQPVDEEVAVLAMQVLHALVSSREARRFCNLLDGNVLESVCGVVGNNAVDHSDSTQTNAQADVSFLGLEILHRALNDIEAAGSTPIVLQSQGAMALLDAVSSQPRFIRALCSTLLSKTGMRVGERRELDGETAYDVPTVYGPSLVLTETKCAGFSSTHEAACSLLFTVCSYACAIESARSKSFWKSACLQDLRHVKDGTDCDRAALTFCAFFLKQLADEASGVFAPDEPDRKQDFERLIRPLVLYRLLESLKDSLDGLVSESIMGRDELDEYTLEVFVSFGTPCTCLALWKDPALIDLSFEFTKQTVDMEPDEILPLFVESKDSLVCLLQLLNLDSSTETIVDIAQMRKFLAGVLGELAERGILTPAVEKFDLRTSAIGALASACMADEQTPSDDDEELAANKFSSGLMQCLAELCTVPGPEGAGKTIQLSPLEAEAIARNLGKKISQMVISRFLERAKLQQYEIDDDENVMEAPEIAMLCAIAQHESALHVLRSLGGLHALAQIASEGDLSAMVALKMGCKDDPNLLLEADTHLSLLSLFSESREAHWRHNSSRREQVEAAAFELLSLLCSGSVKGRAAVANAADMEACLGRALGVISSLVPPEEGGVNDDEEEREGEEEEEGNDTQDDAEEGTEKGTEPKEMPNAIDSNGSQAKPTEAACVGVPVALPTLSPERVDLLNSTLSWLSSALALRTVQDVVVKSKSLSKVCLGFIQQEKGDTRLKLESTKLVAKLGAVSHLAEPFSSQFLGHLFQSALSVEKPSKADKLEEAQLNAVYVNATEGIELIFDGLDETMKRSILERITTLYGKVLKSRSLQRKATDFVFSGELAYNVTNILLLAISNYDVAGCFDLKLLTMLANCVQWRYDPKTVVPAEETRYWDASTTQSLQLLSQALNRSHTRQSRQGGELKALRENVMMVARPGKAPRKAIDLLSALSLVAKTGEASAALAANRIKRTLLAGDGH